VLPLLLVSYPPLSFEFISNIKEGGHVSFALEELSPGAQKTFNVTLQPKLSGVYEAYRAKIKYSPGAASIDDEEDEIRYGHSSSLGKIKIISSAEHYRNTSYNIIEWTLFFVANAALIGFPFYIWRSSRKVILSNSKPR